MKKIVFGVCLGFTLLSAAPISAQDDAAAAKPAEVEAIKKSDFLQAQRVMFNAADKDFDGRVSQDEINLMSDELNKPKHVQAFKDLDADNNGYLSLREVEAKHQEFTSDRQVRLEKLIEGLLTRYDQDGNGNISRRELDAYIEKKSLENEAATLKSATTDLNSKDTDDSGSVSLEEYLSSKTTAGIQKARQARRPGEYLRRDKNGDGLIARSENEAYLLKLFEVLDKNKDDQLSASEQKDRAYKSSKQFSLRAIFISTSVQGGVN